MVLSEKHLLGLKGYPKKDIQKILKTAFNFREVLERPIKKVPSLQGVTIVNLFLRKKSITSINMLKFMLYHGQSNYKTVFGIYWQALKLYIKKVPFYSHPDKREKL